jgi:hypothetical protein
VAIKNIANNARTSTLGQHQTRHKKATTSVTNITPAKQIPRIAVPHAVSATKVLEMEHRFVMKKDLKTELVLDWSHRFSTV